MKKIIFSALTFAAVLVSCSKDETISSAQQDAVVPASVSNAISAYVANNYPDTKVVATTSTASGVVVSLNTGEEVTFSNAGSTVGYTNNISKGIKADSLGRPHRDSTMRDSLGGRGHGRGGDAGAMGGRGGKGGGKGDKGGKGGKGGGTADSTHVKGGKGGSFDPKARNHANDVAVDSLPAAISAYITANFSGYTVMHAEKDTLCSGAVTEVMVCTSTKEPVKLVFDATNAFILKAERALYADAPAAVTAAVTANYSAYTIRTKGEKFTLTDGSIQYKVYMATTTARKAVTFKADGTVVCEE